jgi:Spy/CpxP family protein refolding chaperone
MKAKLLVLILAGFLAAGSMNAQPGNMGNAGMQGKCHFGIPDLTEAQQAQIEKLRTAHMKDVLPLKNELGEREAKLKTLMSSTNPDMNAINAEIEKIGQIKIEMHKKKALHQQDVRKVLTEEQRVMFDMHSGKGMGKGKGYGNCNYGCGMHQGMQRHGNRWGN